jgi:hypothetical protein
MAKIKYYLQKQNLDQASVLINDLEANSHYFQLRDVTDVLHSGRQGFLIAGSNALINDTEVLIEIKDANGDPIFLSAVRNYAEGRARFIAIEVYEDTPPGPATLTILGEAAVGLDGSPIPKEWRGKFNVKYQRQFTVDSLRTNDSKIRVYTTPQLVVSEILSPFRKAITGSLTIISGTQAVGGTLLRIINSANPITNIYTVNTPTFPLSKSMEGGSFTASINEAAFLGIFTSSILLVLNDATMQLESSLIAATGSGAFNSYIPFAASDFTISFKDTDAFSTTTLTRSYADVKLLNLKTFSGDVARAKLFVRSLDSEGDFEPVADQKLEQMELTQTSSAALGPTTRMGYLFDQAVIDAFWTAGSITGSIRPPYVPAASILVTRDTANLLDSIHISNVPSLAAGTGSGAAPQYFIGLSGSVSLPFIAGLEYVFGMDSLCLKDIDSYEAKLAVYLSGSAFPSLDMLGYKVTEISVANGRARSLDLGTAVNFTALNTGDAKLYFVITAGDWYIADPFIESAFETGFNPDNAEFLIPIVNKRFEHLQFKAQLFDPNNNVYPEDIFSNIVFFDGGNMLLRGTDHRVEGKLTVSPSGSGVTISSVGWLDESGSQQSGSAIYLGLGQFFSSGTAILLAEDVSGSPKISIGDKLKAYIDSASGQFVLYVSGTISGSIEIAANSITADKLDVDVLSAITADMGELTAGIIHNIVDDAGIQFSTGSFWQGWNNFINMAATGSQVFLQTSGGAIQATADGDVTLQGNVNASTLVVSTDAHINTQLAVRSLLVATDNVWNTIDNRLKMDGGDLFIYASGSLDSDNPILTIKSFSVFAGTQSGSSTTNEQDTFWNKVADQVILTINGTTEGSDPAFNSLTGSTSVDAIDDQYTVRYALRLNTSDMVKEIGKFSSVVATGYLDYRVADTGSWTNVKTHTITHAFDALATGSDFLFPDSDISAGNLWTSTEATLWEALDEVSPSDVDFVSSGDPADTFIVGMTNPVNTPTGLNRKIRVRHQIDIVGGTDVLVGDTALILYEGTTFKESWGISPVPGYQTDEFTITSSIANYNDLRVGVITDSGLVDDLIDVSWIRIELPFSNANTFGYSPDETQNFADTVTVAGPPSYVEFRLRVQQARTGDTLSGASTASISGSTTTGITWISSAGGDPGLLTHRNLRLFSSGGHEPHLSYAPGPATLVPPIESGSEGDNIWISGSGPYWYLPNGIGWTGLSSSGSNASSSYAVTASFAETASFALNGGGSGGTFLIVGTSLRGDIPLVTNGIASGSVQTGSFSLSKGFILYRVSSSVESRVRLYSSASFRNTDLTRSIGVDPVLEHGVIVDLVLSGSPNFLVYNLAPYVIGVDAQPTPDGQISYTINDLSGVAATHSLSFTILPLEANALSASLIESASYALTCSFFAGPSIPSSSYATTSSFAESASFAVTASAATSITFVPATASFAVTASFAQSASFAETASAATSITFTPATASFAITASLAVTASYAVSASSVLSASYAVTSSFAVSASHAQTAASADLATSAVTALTASNADTASFADPDLFTAHHPIITVDVNPYAVSFDDFTVLIDASSGSSPYKVTLPAIADFMRGPASKVVNIIKIDAGANFVDVVPSGSETLIGDPSFSLVDQYEGVTLQPSSSVWFIV